MPDLKPGCTARVRDDSEHFAGRLVAVKTIADEHDCKRFDGPGAYVWAPGFGWWFPVECLEWVSDEAPVFPREDDDDADELDRIEEVVWNLLIHLAAETHAKSKGWEPLDTIEGQDGIAIALKKYLAACDRNGPAARADELRWANRLAVLRETSATTAHNETSGPYRSPA